MRNIQSAAKAPSQTPRAARATYFLMAVLAGGCFASAAGAQALDTSQLPHAAGAKQIYASAPTTIYAVPDPVAQTAEETDKALAADGWRQYLPPNAEQIKNADQQILTFKKGPQALTALITVPPGGAKTANVNYVALALANDLPFPPDASDIAYSPDTPYLSCVSAQPIEAMLDFFRNGLGALGWSPAPMAEGAKPAAAGAKAAHAYFVRADHLPLLLVVQRGDDGKSKVELKSVPAELLAAESLPAKPAPAAAEIEKPKAPADDAGDALFKQAQQMQDEAIAQALAAAKAPAAPAPSSPVAALAALAGSNASIPLPETAEDVDFDGAEGKLEFNSASNVKSVAAFFRAAMKPLGWKEQPSVIDKPNMVQLDFAKAGKDISLTIMQMGKQTSVTGSGEGLVNGAATPGSEAAAAPAAPAELESEDSGGFPVPRSHTASGNEQTPFRHGLTADVPADMAAVLAFYRRELGKLGWKELTEGAILKPDQAVLAFSTPDGPALLKLVHRDDDTSISLVVRDHDKAAKAGMLPKPGQVRLMLGNVTGGEAILTINKQTIKVAAGVGAKGPDGPKLDLPPGKYKIAFKVAGQPANADEVEVGADETWGVMVGPGGLLPLQVY
ncbi:hypothetical protein [Methylocapsa sp. S129]|uniref:hypothetical protein n=1 Tax=Methylocapsa sp. S129 TaxID=1641869 RepID=UPI00131D1C6C|nr:hypothetical protein [Methylocapsa sp. S129]